MAYIGFFLKKDVDTSTFKPRAYSGRFLNS